MTIRVYKEVEVEVELEDFNDEELIDELKKRGHDTEDFFSLDSTNNNIFKLYQSYVIDNPETFRQTISDFFFKHLGKTV